MGVIYNTDKKLCDFINGQASGFGYNFHSRLGASCSVPAALPPAPVIRPGAVEPAPVVGSSGAIAATPDQMRQPRPLAPVRKPGFWERLFERVSVTPFEWFLELIKQLVATKAWGAAVLVCAVIGATYAANLGWGWDNWAAQIAAVVIGLAAGAAAPYALAAICVGIVLLYVYFVLGLVWLGLIIAGLLLCAVALAACGAAIYGLVLALTAMLA